MIPDVVLAEACQSAYDDPASVERGDCHISLSQSGGVLIVAFRGSQDVSDWVTNFDADAEDDPQLGPVHDGYHKNVIGIFGYVKPIIDAHGLWVATGHSKGGGECLLFAGLMTAVGNAPIAICTLGAPKVGGDRLAEVLSPVAVHQYRNGNDPVPLLPPHPTWRHVRPLIEIGQLNLFPDIADHFVANYLEALYART